MSTILHLSYPSSASECTFMCTHVLQNGRDADLHANISPLSSYLEMVMYKDCKHEHELIQYLIVMEQFGLIANPLFMLVYFLTMFTEHIIHVHPAVYMYIMKDHWWSLFSTHAIHEGK